MRTVAAIPSTISGICSDQFDLTISPSNAPPAMNVTKRALLESVSICEYIIAKYQNRKPPTIKKARRTFDIHKICPLIVMDQSLKGKKVWSNSKSRAIPEKHAIAREYNSVGNIRDFHQALTITTSVIPVMITAADNGSTSSGDCTLNTSTQLRTFE
jgi:hypothetical protein